MASNVENYLKYTVAYGIPIASFFISMFALYRTSKSRKTEDRIRELELYIKEHNAKEILAKEHKIPEAKIEARIIKISKSKYSLKVWNSGNIRAFSINVEIPEEFEIIIIGDKLPFDYLDPKDSFEEHVVIHLGSHTKFNIKTMWKDKDGNTYEDIQLRSI